MHVTADEDKIEIDITNAHDWGELKGKPANEI
jgi:hypothetical protein